MCSASSTKPSHTSAASSRSQSLSGRPGRWAMPAWLTRWCATRACPAVPPGGPPAKPRSSPDSPRWPVRWPRGTSMPTKPKPSPGPMSATRHAAPWSRLLRVRGPTPHASEPRPRRSQPDTRRPSNASCVSTPTDSCGSTTTATAWCASRGHSTPTTGPGSRPRSPPSPTGCGRRTRSSPPANAAVPNSETSTPCAPLLPSCRSRDSAVARPAPRHPGVGDSTRPTDDSPTASPRARSPPHPGSGAITPTAAGGAPRNRIARTPAAPNPPTAQKPQRPGPRANGTWRRGERLKPKRARRT